VVGNQQRQLANIRQEGRDYLMMMGDVVEFLVGALFLLVISSFLLESPLSSLNLINYPRKNCYSGNFFRE
jgi:hypothetical protein